MMRFYTTVGSVRSLAQRLAASRGADITLALQKEALDGLELSGRLLQTDHQLAPGLALSVDELHRLPLSLHSNHIDFNPASANPYVRRAALTQLQDELRLCENYCIPILTMHPGWARRITRPQALEHLWHCLAEVLDHDRDQRTLICMENMDHRSEKLCNTTDEIAQTLKRFPRLMLTVDLAHLGLTGIDAGSFLDRFEDRIAHLHISGVSRGKRHAQVSLADSEVDFRPQLRRFRGTDIALVIENDSWETTLSSMRFLSTLRE